MHEELADFERAYRVSGYGRIGYFVMSGFWLLLSPLALYFQSPSPTVPFWVGVIFTSLGVTALFNLIHSVVQTFRHAPRFIVGLDALHYRGTFLRTSIPWKQISRCRLDMAGRMPMAYIFLNLKERVWGKKWLRLDASGLAPNYLYLLTEIQFHLKAASNPPLNRTRTDNARAG